MTRPRSPHNDRNKVLRQALRAMIILRAGRWTMVELADELGVGWRTAYRIVDGIREAGIAVEVSPEPNDGQTRGSVHYRISADAVRTALQLFVELTPRGRAKHGSDYAYGRLGCRCDKCRAWKASVRPKREGPRRRPMTGAKAAATSATVANVVAARIGAGLTQQALADALGVSQSVVAQIEGGRRAPTARYVADALRVVRKIATRS